MEYKFWKPPEGEKAKIRILGEMYGMHEHYYFGNFIKNHYHAPNRRATDVVMKKNKDGVYEQEDVCPTCDIIRRRNLNET